MTDGRIPIPQVEGLTDALAPPAAAEVPFTPHGGLSSTNVQAALEELDAEKAAVAGGLTVQDENGTVATGVTQLDFQGANVTAAAGAGEVVVTVAGSAGAGGQLLERDGLTPPLAFSDLLTNEAQDTLLYSD